MNAALFSFKYEANWRFIQVDTLWPLPQENVKWQPENVCGIERDRVLAAKKIDSLNWIDCPAPDPTNPNFRREIRIYQY